VSRKAEKGLSQGFVLVPALYSLHTYDAPVVFGVRAAVLVYAAGLYGTEEGACVVFTARYSADSLLAPYGTPEQGQASSVLLLFMVTPCINNIPHFNFQLMHTTLKNVELLKHFKISKTAQTCFGLQGNHHQGTTISKN